jgi:hypothetical protein
VISLNLVLAGLRLGLKNRQVGEKWEIFLEETWVLNKEGRFERLRESTKGSIILFSNMVSLNCLKKINNTQGFIFKVEKIACMIGLFMRVKTVRGRLVV